jgi:hypothetical protein
MLIEVLLVITKFDVKVAAWEEVKRGISGVYGLVSKRQTLAARCMAALKLPQICRDYTASAFVSFIILPLIGRRVELPPHNVSLSKLLRTANLPA